MKLPLTRFNSYIHESGFLPNLLNVQHVVLGNQSTSFGSCWSLIHSLMAQWKQGAANVTFQVRNVWFG